MNWLKNLFSADSDDYLPEVDEADWNEAWENRPAKMVKLPLKFDPSGMENGNLGNMTSTHVALEPKENSKYIYKCGGDRCPLCGNSAEKEAALAASFSLVWELFPLSLGGSAWIHAKYYEDCEKQIK